MNSVKVTGAIDQNSRDGHVVLTLSPHLLDESSSRISELLGYPLVLKKFDFEGKNNQILILPRASSEHKLILMGWEDEQEEAYLALRHTAAQLGKMIRSQEGSYYFWRPAAANVEKFLLHVSQGVGIGLYDPKIWVSKPLESKSFELCFCGPEKTGSLVDEATALLDVTQWMRFLQDMPPNELIPEKLAQLAKERFASYSSLKFEVFNTKKMEELGFGAFLAVARGAECPPCTIKVHYKHPQADKKLLVVGKALTFDSGGKDIKDRNNMLDMKYDMSGGALALALVELVARLELRLELLVLVGAAENSIDGKSYNPNDILTAYNGKTIEVIDTDAEGRLVLADLLAYGEQTFSPDHAIEFSTLTGAILFALGSSAAGIFGNPLAKKELLTYLKKASEDSEERLWELPVYPEHGEFMKGVFSDLQNIGARFTGGSSTAAAFLFEFIEKTPYVHFDIAGMAFGIKGKGYGSTQAGGRCSSGFGLLVLREFLKRLSQ
jgi:leucyl aminopeptidase